MVYGWASFAAQKMPFIVVIYALSSCQWIFFAIRIVCNRVASDNIYLCNR